MNIIVEIEGMTCQHCVMSVRKELEKITGMHIAELGIGKAVLNSNSSSDAAAQIRDAVERAGYNVRSIQ